MGRPLQYASPAPGASCPCISGLDGSKGPGLGPGCRRGSGAPSFLLPFPAAVRGDPGPRGAAAGAVAARAARPGGEEEASAARGGAGPQAIRPCSVSSWASARAPEARNQSPQPAPSPRSTCRCQGWPSCRVSRGRVPHSSNSAFRASAARSSSPSPSTAAICRAAERSSAAAVSGNASSVRSAGRSPCPASSSASAARGSSGAVRTASATSTSRRAAEKPPRGSPILMSFRRTPA